MKGCKFINDTFEAYKEEILNGTEQERLRFFKIALENVEREARDAALIEVYQVANVLANKTHYDYR